MVSRMPSGECTSSGATVKKILGGPNRRIMASILPMQDERSIVLHGTELATRDTNGMIGAMNLAACFE
jgi:hypothetical protein